MRYEIIYADIVSVLEEKVEVYLQSGWKCQGGVFVAITPPGALVGRQVGYYQAMVHE